MRQSIVFDLDDTICKPNHDRKDSYGKYALAEPIWPMIDKIRELSGKYDIIIATARRMVTHDGDVDKIEEDVGELTRLWLHDHGVPYHQLYFGKPYAIAYVDDKALSIKEFLEKEF